MQRTPIRALRDVTCRFHSVHPDLRLAVLLAGLSPFERLAMLRAIESVTEGKEPAPVGSRPRGRPPAWRRAHAAASRIRTGEGLTRKGAA